MGFGSPAWQGWVLDEEKSLPIIYHAYQQGINTWDTVGPLPVFFSFLSSGSLFFHSLVPLLSFFYFYFLFFIKKQIQINFEEMTHIDHHARPTVIQTASPK